MISFSLTKQNTLCRIGGMAAAVVIGETAFCGNPLFTDMWTADPGPFVDGDRLYIYAGHDAAATNEMFNIPDWVCYSTTDLQTWQNHGSLLDATDFPHGEAKKAWASQVVKKNGKYYWYVTFSHTGGGGMSVGVAVGDSALGPFTPADNPVVMDRTTPSPYWGNDIDPTVFIDSDGTAWMAWGNPVCYLAKLKSNMVEIDGEIRVIPLPNYTEAPWLDKRGDTYYLIYASRAHQGYGEHVDYATAPSIEGPWTYRGRITGGAMHSYTIHPGLANFNGHDIFVYHNATLELDGIGGGTGRRCVTADWIEISPNGPIKALTQTTEGLDLPAPANGSYTATFEPVATPSALEDGFRFSQSAISPVPCNGITNFVQWTKGAAFKNVENPFMDAPQCDGFNLDGGHESISESFTLEKDIALSRIEFYMTDGEGTDADNPLTIAVRRGDVDVFSVGVNYVPQGYGTVALEIDREKRPLLQAGVEYTLELRGKKWSPVAYWRRGYDGKSHAFALYEDTEDLTHCLLAYQTPGNSGGLSFLGDNGDGIWGHGYNRDTRMTYSNLGNWGEKKLFEPFVIRTTSGDVHLFYGYSGVHGPSLGHAMSWNRDNVRNWGRENWIDLSDLPSTAKVAGPLVSEREDGNLVVLFRDDSTGRRYRVATDGKKALGACEEIDASVYDAAYAKLVRIVEFDGRAYTGNVVRVTKEMRDGLKSDFGEWHKSAPWHLTIDSAKDDESRYSQISTGASLKLSVNTSSNSYEISDKLVGLFFEDINNSYEMYSTNHAGTYKGHGWRKDAGEALAALKPKFMRFPGGCIVHGTSFKSMYHWKETVGPLSERKGKPNPLWGTYQDFALGYFEYFQLCEDMGAEPVPVLPAGVTCPNPQIAVTDEELQQLITDAVDLIDFAKGDPEKSKWAKVRADMGHPEPFRLNYIGVGNEDDINDYFERGFTPIFEAIKAKDPSITVIGSAGPSASGRDYEEGWKHGRRLNVPILDEHYYVGCGWMYGNKGFYDDYDRNGPKVYLGEYAAHKDGRVNDMETALACAVHLTNLERNGDVVAMASYAPLFAKKGATRWETDLIYFDDDKLYLTMDYWTQWIFGNYRGTIYVPNTLTVTPGASNLNEADRQRYCNRFSSSIVKDGRKIIVKVVNTTSFPIPFEADLSAFGVKDGQGAEIVEFAGSSFDATDAEPVKSNGTIGPTYKRTLPKNSLTVISFADPRAGDSGGTVRYFR